MQISERATRRLWLIGLWLLLPWPVIVFGDVWVPAARYTALATAASAIAITQGAGGPVLGVTGLFVGWALATSLICWALAWGIARLLAMLPGRAPLVTTVLVLAGGLLWALLLDPYTMRFGNTPSGGLLDLLS